MRFKTLLAIAALSAVIGCKSDNKELLHDSVDRPAMLAFTVDGVSCSSTQTAGPRGPIQVTLDGRALAMEIDGDDAAFTQNDGFRIQVDGTGQVLRAFPEDGDPVVHRRSPGGTSAWVLLHKPSEDWRSRFPWELGDEKPPCELTIKIKRD